MKETDTMRGNQDTQAMEQCHCSNVGKAVMALNKLVAINHVTPEIVATANMMLKDYEQEKAGRYVHHLQEEIRELRELLATRDAHHKALRAKELGILRGKMIGLHNVEEIDTVPLAHDAIDECVSLVDELIEKPTK